MDINSIKKKHTICLTQIYFLRSTDNHVYQGLYYLIKLENISILQKQLE